MAGKQKAKSKPKKMSAEDLKVYLGENPEPEFEESEETVIITPRGAAVGMAFRFFESATEFRGLITLRAGTQAHKIKFDFGNYGSGPQVRGGGDGSPPDCP
jgi:hypothetical protein